MRKLIISILAAMTLAVALFSASPALAAQNTTAHRSYVGPACFCYWGPIYVPIGYECHNGNLYLHGYLLYPDGSRYYFGQWVGYC